MFSCSRENMHSPGGTGQPCLRDALASGFTGQPPPYPLSAVFSRPSLQFSPAKTGVLKVSPWPT